MGEFMKNLKVYYFEFDALWMGGNALVVAGDELDAQFLLEDKFKEQFKDKELEIRKVEEIDIHNEGVKIIRVFKSEILR